MFWKAQDISEVSPFTHREASRSDQDLAEYLAVLKQPFRFSGLIKWQHAIDDRCQLVTRDQVQQRSQVLSLPTIGTDQGVFERPPIASIECQVETCCRATAQNSAAERNTLLCRGQGIA